MGEANFRPKGKGGVTMFERKNYGWMLYGFLILAITLTFNCGGGGGGDSSGGPGPVTPEWTYMIYLAGDNNLSEAAEDDIAEMATVGSTSAVNVVVQAEFSQDYSGGGVPADTRRVLVQKDMDLIAASTSIGNVNMADPATLTAFIQWATQTYPAKHYALVIWDHGAGWKASSLEVRGSVFRGAVQDLTSGSFMSLPDLAKGVRDSGMHIDLINFDACLMAMYEVAYEFKGLTDYMVFAEETEPGDGDPYDTILAALTANPTMSGRTLASMIVDKFDDFYSTDSRAATTKSSIDMSQIEALDAKILALSDALPTDVAANTFFQAAQSETQDYAYAANHDLYDVCDYVSTRLSSGTVKTTCTEIMSIINGMVINNKINGAEVTGSHGLAIYLPTADETDTTDLGKYASLACNSVRASGSGTWGSYIEYLLSGVGNVNYVEGGFAIALLWVKPDLSDCDADLDLYIWEPTVDFATTGNGEIYAPWMGQTTLNGFFSQDSYDSGESVEYYVANNQVYYGDYFLVVNYFNNGPNCSMAEAHILIHDPNVDVNWFELTSANVGFDMLYPSPQSMSLDNVYTGGCGDLPCFNSYTDWWVPDAYIPARGRGTGATMLNQSPPIGDKKSQMIFRYRKEMRLFPNTE